MKKFLVGILVVAVLLSIVGLAKPIRGPINDDPITHNCPPNC
jgi:hypothetical protein